MNQKEAERLLESLKAMRWDKNGRTVGYSRQEIVKRLSSDGLNVKIRRPKR